MQIKTDASTARSAFPNLGTISFEVQRESTSWSRSMTVAMPLFDQVVVSFVGRAKKLVLGVVFEEIRHATYMLTRAEFVEMEKLKTPEEQHDFAAGKGRSATSSHTELPLGIARGHEDHPQVGFSAQSVPSLTLEDYLDERARIGGELEEIAASKGLSFVGEPDDPFINVTHQTAAEFHTNSRLRELFPGEISVDNPVGLDFDRIHDTLISRGRGAENATDAGLISPFGATFDGKLGVAKITQDILPPKPQINPNVPAEPSDLQIFIDTTFSKVSFKLADGSSLDATVPATKSTILFDKATRKGLLRTEQFKGHFEIERDKYKKQSSKSTSIGFSIGISLLSSAAGTVHNDMNVGDEATVSQEHQEKLEKSKNEEKEKKQGKGSQSENGGEKKAEKQEPAQSVFEGPGGFSVALGASLMIQKTKAYEADTLRFLTEATVENITKDVLDFSS